MRTSTSNVGEKVFTNVVAYEKVKAQWELVAEIGKGMATNRNGLGIEFE
jgi:hypothetical protein